MGDLRYQWVFAYIVDMLIQTDNVEEGFKILERVLELILKAGFQLKLEICAFL